MAGRPQRRDRVKEAQQKQRRLFSTIFFYVSAASLALLLLACLIFPGRPPILLSAPEEATQRLEAMLGHFQAGDYDQARLCMLGTPELGVRPETNDPLDDLLWDAIRESLSFSLEGKCYTTKEGLARDLQVTCIDVTKLTDRLSELAPAIMEEKVAQATDPGEIYDAAGEYRAEFVSKVLAEAASRLLAENPATTTVTVTVNLKLEDGQWWVVADTKLLSALFGGTLY